MGDFYDIGPTGFEPRNGTVDMVQEVNRNSVRFPKIAFWVQDPLTGAIMATKARRIRRPWPITVVIKEAALGTEKLISVVVYTRLGAPVSLEFSAFVDAAGNPVPLKDPDGRSQFDIRWNEVKELIETQALWAP